jgi:hypothetical protein
LSFRPERSEVEESLTLSGLRQMSLRTAECCGAQQARRDKPEQNSGARHSCRCARTRKHRTDTRTCASVRCD